LLEEHDTLNSYLHLEQYCQPVSFDYTIELPEGYNPEEIQIPSMIIQPFVENAVIHGIAHRKDKGLILVKFTLDQELLTCSITDNGPGMKKAAELKVKPVKGHQSVAMDVTQKRLLALKNGMLYDHFSVEDITKENGQVNGIRVIIKMPAELEF